MNERNPKFDPWSTDIDFENDDLFDNLDSTEANITKAEVNRSYEDAKRIKKEFAEEKKQDRKLDHKEKLEERERKLKDKVNDYKQRITKEKEAFLTKSKEIEETDIRFNITIIHKIKNFFGFSKELKNFQIDYDAKRKQQLETGIKKINEEKKGNREELINQQGKLGNQIKKDRLARWTGEKFGKLSDETRSELRDQQKMLGRVIRSGQRNAIIDKVAESASNLKNKIFSSNKPKSR